MKQVEILTFSMSPSYGAMMQCYALASVLKQMGCDVRLTNVKLPCQDSWKYQIAGRLYRHRQFIIFRKLYLPRLIERRYNKKTDLYIVGSDQVWNPAIVGRKLDIFFFSYLPSDAKRISYAASFGMDSWLSNASSIDNIKKYLSGFSGVSVRETYGKQICNDTFGVDAEVVLDPTLLLEDYSNLVGQIKEKNVIMSYKFSDSEQYREMLLFLSDKLNLPVEDLCNNKTMSVRLWLKRIASAKMVITDSFHCLVFAIIFKRQFIALPTVDGRSGRLYSLLRLLNLEDRFYGRIDNIYDTDEWQNIINFEESESRLNVLRKYSLTFLKRYV